MKSHHAVCLAVLLSGVGLNGVYAQEATRALESGGLSFEVPTSWESTTPGSAMRKLQMAVPAAGDGAPGELALFVFPGGAGTVKANIDRWQNQFQKADGSAAAATTEVRKGKNVDVTRVEVAGTFTDPFSGKGAQASYRLLGAIVDTPEGGYFFKLVGPDKTVAGASAAFDAMIASMNLAQ